MNIKCTFSLAKGLQGSRAASATFPGFLSRCGELVFEEQENDIEDYREVLDPAFDRFWR
jgi:hypothetical protein